MRTKKVKSPKYQILDNPFYGLTVDQRRLIGAELKSKSTEKLQEAVDRIELLFQQYDPLQLLSMLASYELTVGIGPKGIQKYRGRSEPVHQANVEFCQAIALKQDQFRSRRPAGPGDYQVLRDSIGQMTSQRAFVDYDDEIFELDEKEGAIRILQHQIRAQSSMVRNWGHFDQVVRMSRDLFAPIAPEIEKGIGFNADHAISVFKAMIKLCETGFSAHRNRWADLLRLKNKRAIIHKYFDQIGEDREAAERFIAKFGLKKGPKRDLILFFMSHQDLFLSNIFTFSPAQVAAQAGCDEVVVERVLEFFSLQFGALKDVVASELFLKNPIREKVIIKIEQGRYFCPLPQVFFSFILPSLDKLVEEAKFEGLPKRRSDFLEDEVEKIVKTRFPSANSVRNVKWGHEGRIYETDLITIIDSYAIIFEAKSGRITPSALRGAPDRIRRHLNDILISPNIQSRRLAEKLNSILNGERDENLTRQLPEQFNKVKRIIRVSVSLEPFSIIQSHVWNLRNTGWLPDDFQPCPSIGLGDFEVIFQILEHPVQIIHYLERRAELETEFKYMGDEMDLLGLYLSTLFNLQIPPNEHLNLNIYGMSEPIDDYFSAREVGSSVPRPRANICKFWHEVISQLEGRQVERWTELGSELLRFSAASQEKIVRMAKSREKSVQMNWQDENHENILVFFPPPPAETSIAIFLFKDENLKRRHEYLDAALSHGLGRHDGRIKKCIAIGRNIDRDDIAYHLICLGE